MIAAEGKCIGTVQDVPYPPIPYPPIPYPYPPIHFLYGISSYQRRNSFNERVARDTER